MIYEKGYEYVPVYKYVSTNQHGGRYMQTGTKKLSVCKVTATDAAENKQLILLGTTLDTPVRWDFKSHEAYLELVSGEEVKTLK